MVLARRLLATGTAVAGLALVLPALPAAAAPPEGSGRAFLDVVRIDEVRTEANFCGTGLDVEIHQVVTDRSFFTFHGPDSIPYFHGNVQERTTFTEPDGTTVTLRSSTVNKDQHIVDNGDGKFTITAFGAGGFTLTGPEGKVRNPGRQAVRFIVDTMGTPLDPTDDVEVPGSFRLIGESTGLNEGTGSLCGDYLLVTGRAG